MRGGDHASREAKAEYDPELDFLAEAIVVSLRRLRRPVGHQGQHSAGDLLSGGRHAGEPGRSLFGLARLRGELHQGATQFEDRAVAHADAAGITLLEPLGPATRRQIDSIRARQMGLRCQLEAIAGAQKTFRQFQLLRHHVAERDKLEIKPDQVFLQRRRRRFIAVGHHACRLHAQAPQNLEQIVCLQPEFRAWPAIAKMLQLLAQCPCPQRPRGAPGRADFILLRLGLRRDAQDRLVALEKTSGMGLQRRPDRIAQVLTLADRKVAGQQLVGASPGMLIKSKHGVRGGNCANFGNAGFNLIKPVIDVEQQARGIKLRNAVEQGVEILVGTQRVIRLFVLKA
ncbi:MAG: hypothetical protein IPK39_12825 [Sulfuritalea sp.]|nr:hypothetical protein [Sulfuritalea sp.]